jgi:hypothetical protein
VALRQAMRKFWALPVESKFRDSGTDWLQNLLAQADEGMRPRILLLLWRAWHLRNDVIHQDGKALIDASVVFLQGRQPLACACHAGPERQGDCSNPCHQGLHGAQLSRSHLVSSPEGLGEGEQLTVLSPTVIVLEGRASSCKTTWANVCRLLVWP